MNAVPATALHSKVDEKTTSRAKAGGMSFGVSVGDFLAVIELAKKVRKEFSGAPSQFSAIAAE